MATTSDSSDAGARSSSSCSHSHHSNSSGDEARRVTPRAGQKRKPTYYMRKEETATLQEELEALKARVAELSAKKKPVMSLGDLARPAPLNSLLHHSIDASNAMLAGMQSMLSAHLGTDAGNPLSTYIHLPVELEARNAVLQSMRRRKLDSAMQFMVERSRFLDLRSQHRNTTSFELPNRDYVFAGFDVTLFENVESVKRVYDEFRFFVSNQEITISENMGILTIRETDACDTSTAMQCRLLSTVADGCDVESNGAMFAEYVEAAAGARPYAVGTMDFVDRDDVFPYQPPTRVRKDMTTCVVITECPPRDGSTTPLIAMSRWSYVRLHRPAFHVPKPVEKALRQSLSQWCDVMPKVMRERLTMRQRVASF